MITKAAVVGSGYMGGGIAQVLALAGREVVLADASAELAASNRELHFRKDEESGRVIIQVRDLAGNVLRTIPPSEALAVMSGAPILWPASPSPDSPRVSTPRRSSTS